MGFSKINVIPICYINVTKSQDIKNSGESSYNTTRYKHVPWYPPQWQKTYYSVMKLPWECFLVTKCSEHVPVMSFKHVSKVYIPDVDTVHKCDVVAIFFQNIIAKRLLNNTSKVMSMSWCNISTTYSSKHLYNNTLEHYPDVKAGLHDRLFYPNPYRIRKTASSRPENTGIVAI